MAGCAWFSRGSCSVLPPLRLLPVPRLMEAHTLCAKTTHTTTQCLVPLTHEPLHASHVGV